jgi:hypothetical protein
MKKLSSMRLHCSVLIAASTILVSCASDAEKTNSTESTPLTNVVTAAVSATNAPAKPAVRIEPAKVVTSPGLEEIIQLCQANVDESVILAYIERSPIAYNPSAEEIVYLNDIGISPTVVAALLKHGRDLTDQAAENAAKTETIATPVLADTNAPSTTTSNTIVIGAPNTLNNPAPETMVVQNPVPPATQVLPETQTVTTTEVAPPQQPVTINYFYSSLSPYGTWMQVDDYGWCWQPSVVTTYPTWQPYCDRGRWLYSDYGWYWQSDYSWGWAPFHYGRWFRHGGYGWVWCPDTVWGSSWVSWRRSPGYCGWAPLPPGAYFDSVHGWAYHGRYVGVGFDFGLSFDCFTFVSLGHFCDRNPYRHFVDRDHRRPIFGETTIDNNYRRGPGGRVINEGIGRDRISAVTHSEIRPVAVRDMPPGSPRAIRPDRTGKEGKDVVIYRPNPQQPPPAMTGATAKRPDNNRPPVSLVGPGTSHPISSPRAGEPQTGTLKSVVDRPSTTPASTAPPSVANPAIGRREATTTRPTPILAPTPKAVEQRKSFSERTPVAVPKVEPARTAPATSTKPIQGRVDSSPRMPVSNVRAPAWTPAASTPSLSAPAPAVRSPSAPAYSKPAEAVRSVNTISPARTPVASPAMTPAQGTRFNTVAPSMSPAPVNRSVSKPSAPRMESAPVRQIQQAPVRSSAPPVQNFSAPRGNYVSPSVSPSPSPRPATAPSSSSSGRGNQNNGKRP